MALLHFEKLGGLANFGGPRSRLRSRGQLDTESLPQSDVEALEALFHTRRAKAKKASQTPADTFRIRVTRATDSGEESVEVSESQVPPVVFTCLKDELL